MPELPEVENVVRRIRPLIVGKTIKRVSVSWLRTLGGVTRSKFESLTLDKKIVTVSRRGKYILIELEPDGFLVVHLRMSGDLLLDDSSIERDKHLRVALYLSSSHKLRFIDARKFGRFTYHDNLNNLFQRLGPEPIDRDFDIDQFYQRLKTTRRAIKTVLLDQQWIAGLGNIYVLETLWRAEINPRTRADSLSRPRVEKMVRFASEVLSEAIESHGTDIGDGVWKTGTFVPQIYGRAGQACLRCAAVIKKIRLAQRGTEYCPRCQSR
jgi:formamidopyrimidine-DNA glycosylase